MRLKRILVLSCLLVLLAIVLIALPVSADGISFGTHVDYITGTGNSYTYGVVTADFDKDGKPDIVAVNQGDSANYTTYPGAVTLFKGDGAGGFTRTFTLTLGSRAPVGGVVADFNKDGNLDLAITNSAANTVNTLLGNGSGSFSLSYTTTVGTNPQGLAVGDFNKDGKPDLIVAARGATNKMNLLLGSGTGAFTVSTLSLSAGANLIGPMGVTTGDFDRDGNPDFAVTGYDSTSCQVFFGTGSGSFYLHSTDARPPRVLSTSTTPKGVATGDLNADGNLDLVVGTDGSNSGVDVFLGSGGGAFATKVNYSAAANPGSVAIADFNGDGIPDLAAAASGASNANLFQGVGNGTFGTASGFTTYSGPNALALGDFNRDGKPDIVTASRTGLANRISVLLNTTAWLVPGQAYNTPVSYGTGSAYAYAVTASDINNDGKTDLVVGSSSGATIVPFIGDGAGGFTAGAALSPGSGIYVMVAGDFNRDGLLELAATRADGNVQVINNTVAGGLAAGPTYPVVASGTLMGLATGDLNGDGALDLVAVANRNDAGNTIGVLLNNGTGVFNPAVSYTTATAPSYVALADLDGNGTLDVAVTNYAAAPGGTVSIFSNDGAGVLTLSGTLANINQAEGIVAGDFDRDGDQDLAIAGNGSIYIRLNNGSGTFSGSGSINSGFQNRPLVATDLNRDGILDLAAGRYQSGANPLAVVLGVGNGTFGNLTSYAGAAANAALPGIAVADFNRDGGPDLAVVQPKSTPPLPDQLFVRLSKWWTPPAIASADHATFALGGPGSFTVTATGVPTATLSKTGTLPTGVTWTANGNGTATLSGTPGAATSGTYPLALKATNGARPDATQAFTLTVAGNPHIVATKRAAPPAGVAYQGIVTYTIAISNTGSGSDTSVVVTDVLPARVSFKQWLNQPAGAQVDGGTLNWTGAIANGALITFRFEVTSAAMGGATITNTVQFRGTANSGTASAVYTAASPCYPGGSNLTWSAAFSACPDPNSKRIIPAGVTVTLDGDITLYSDLEVQGTLNPNGKTVTLAGSAAQTLTGNPLNFYNLVLNKTNQANTVTVLGKLKVTKKLTITRGKLISASDYADIEIGPDGELVLTNDITIGGDLVVGGGITNTGTLTTGGHKITFDGAKTQNLSLAGLTIFDDLEVTADTVLIETNSYDNAYVQGALTNSGTIRKTQLITAAEPYYFGLAGDVDGADLTITVTVPGSLSAITVDRHDADHPHATGSPAAGAGWGRFWTITPSGAGFTADIALPHHVTPQEDASACFYTDNGATWVCGRQSVSADLVTFAGTTHFSDWAVGKGMPTAVTLAGFSADPGPGLVRLAWQTADEHDLLGFNLYRATAVGGPYVRLNAGLIPHQDAGLGAGYTWLDRAAAPGQTYYYQLDWLDAQGQGTRFGPVVAAALPGQAFYLPLVMR